MAFKSKFTAREIKRELALSQRDPLATTGKYETTETFRLRDWGRGLIWGS